MPNNKWKQGLSLQIRELVTDTLKGIKLHSKAAENLIMGTGAVESHYHYLRQLGSGVAVSFFQVEGATVKDNIENYLSYRPERLSLITDYCMTPTPAKLLDYNAAQLRSLTLHNIAFAIAMARVLYFRVPKKLPSEDDIEGMAKYWKKYYNTPLGKGTEEKFIEAYNLL